ncbi:predicted protein [Naegleria gruberi]|uniref:Predicted protein n=1 Tax=Naegleria gruberi TaxID=5762 RepID=D2V4R1_NAEGR|nr:uncharacterized protein NAEGRDRAFT_63877 [Naegleria gruberi]EFC48146.1 predicted protein [Naegleria gruberi]|eukprot:XP_002680890.1 predicted protein [Naegleria gruberi strain NEG-M]
MSADLSLISPAVSSSYSTCKKDSMGENIGKIVTMVFVVPRVDVHAPPSSDVLLNAFKHTNPSAFKVTEIMTGVLVFILLVISLAHGRERVYILPRFLFIRATLINLRTLCISFTTFSIPTRVLSQQCSNLQELTQEKLWKSINLFEFSETCGDYVFSGHATTLIVAVWFVWYYRRSISIISSLSSSRSSSAFIKLMNVLLICLVVIGCMCILFAKEHYSVDVFVGGLISVMRCALYHLLVDLYRKRCEEDSIIPEKCGVVYSFVVQIGGGWLEEQGFRKYLTQLGLMWKIKYQLFRKQNSLRTSCKINICNFSKY